MSQAQEPDGSAVQEAQPAPHGTVLAHGRPAAPVSQEKADLVFSFMEAVASFLVDMSNSNDLGRSDRERAQGLIDQMRQL